MTDDGNSSDRTGGAATMSAAPARVHFARFDVID